MSARLLSRIFRGLYGFAHRKGMAKKAVKVKRKTAKEKAICSANAFHGNPPQFRCCYYNRLISFVNAFFNVQEILQNNFCFDYINAYLLEKCRKKIKTFKNCLTIMFLGCIVRPSKQRRFGQKPKAPYFLYF